MRTIQVAVATIILLSTACSPTKPDDGFVQVISITSGIWPESVVGIRVAAKTRDPNGYWVVSEAFLSATDELLSAHSARNDTTYFETTFSLPPDHYYLFLEALVKQWSSLPATYYVMGINSSAEVESGKTDTVQLSGSFDWFIPK